MITTEKAPLSTNKRKAYWLGNKHWVKYCSRKEKEAIMAWDWIKLVQTQTCKLLYFRLGACVICKGLTCLMAALGGVCYATRETHKGEEKVKKENHIATTHICTQHCKPLRSGSDTWRIWPNVIGNFSFTAFALSTNELARGDHFNIIYNKYPPLW